MAKKQGAYMGSAGVHAVMSEFLWRGYNVAQPEVDVGEDVLVIEDQSGRMHRVQVKTATAKGTRASYQALFNIALSQVENRKRPDLHFILVVRLGDRWEDFLLIPRTKLHDERVPHEMGGAPNKRGMLLYRLRLTPAGVSCDGVDLSEYRNNWDSWPVVPH